MKLPKGDQDNVLRCVEVDKEVREAGCGVYVEVLRRRMCGARVVRVSGGSDLIGPMLAIDPYRVSRRLSVEIYEN
jgi:hypothetical protein